LASSDFATTLPGALLQAVMSDAKTKVLQAPQLRTVDNAKASIKIGEKEPTASGSFQPGIGGVGINPLVNTQFQYLDVGVNVEILPHVHDNGDISMHVTLDISSVIGQAPLGGINEPIIGQRKVDQDIYMRDGEVGLLGGLINQQDDKTVTGIPGLSSIPLLRRLFTGESVDHNKSELMIVMIPHILRRQEISAESLRAVATGTQAIQVHYGPKIQPPAPAEPPAAKQEAVAPGIPVAPAPVAPAPVAPAVAAAAAPPKPEPVAPSTVPIQATPSATPPPATAPALPPGMTLPPTGGPPAPGALLVTPPGSPGAPAATTPDSPPPPGTQARVRFIPPQTTTTVNSTVTASVIIEGGTDVASAPMQLVFDPKVLRLNDVTLGNFLSADGQEPVFTKNIMNDAGQATIQLSRQPGSPGITGPAGTLVTLTFTAIGPGTGTVTIPNVSVRNSQGQPLSSGNPQFTVSVK
jgi:general secretion pathway protein D